MKYRLKVLIVQKLLAVCSFVSACNSSSDEGLTGMPIMPTDSPTMTETTPDSVSDPQNTDTDPEPGSGELYSQSNNSALLFGPMIKGIGSSGTPHRKKIGYSVSSSDPQLQLTSAYYLDGMEDWLRFHEQIIGTVKNISSQLFCRIQIDGVQFFDTSGQSLGENLQTHFLLIAGSIGHRVDVLRLSGYRCLAPGEEVHFYSSTYYYGQDIENIAAVRFGKLDGRASTTDYQLGDRSLLPTSYTVDEDSYSVTIKNTSNQGYSLSDIQSIFLDAGSEPIGVLLSNYSDFQDNHVICPGAQRTIQSIPDRRFAADASAVRVVVGAFTLEEERVLMECP